MRKEQTNDNNSIDSYYRYVIRILVRRALHDYTLLSIAQLLYILRALGF